MAMKRALAGFLLLTALYVGALAWVDARRQVFDGLVALAGVLPGLMALSLVTYGLRYARWHWLLARAGHATPAGVGFLAYLAGFAFTATPGKVGELIRVRYFVPLGVPAARVISVFVFERALDLVVVLALALLAIRDTRLLAVAALFVLGCLVLVAALGRWPGLLMPVEWRLTAWRWFRLAHGVRALSDGFRGIGVWMRPRDLAVGVVLGALAWGGTAAGLVYLLHHLGVTTLPEVQALAIYPQAMLAGAASMLPGGVGSTETAIAALLSLAGVALPIGLLAAIGIRLATLWFAILCGLVAVVVLERRLIRHTGPRALQDGGAGIVMNLQTDKGGMNNTQRTTFVAGLIVLAVIGLHFAFGVRFPVPWVDESYFLLQSLSLAEHNTLVTPALIPDRPVMWMQPGYVLLTGLYFKAVDFSLLHARQLSLAFYAIAIWVYCRALCRDTGWLGAMVAAVIFLIPSSLAVSNVARMESIVLALGLGVLACTQHQHFVTSAALTVLAALVHPNGAYFALPLAVGLWLARAEWRNALRQTAAGEWILLAVSVLLAGGYAAFVVRHLDAFQVDMAFQFARKLARKPFYLDPRAVVTLGLGLAVVVVCLRAGDYRRTVAAVFATTLVLIFANGQEMWYQVFRNVGLGMLILLAVTGLRASLPRAIAASVLLAGFCALFGLQFVGMRPGFTSGGPVAPRVSQSMEEQLAATRRAHPGPFTVAFNNTGLDMLYLDFLRREEITLVRRMPVEMTPAVTVDLCLHVVGADDPPWLHEDALAEFPDPRLCRLGAFVSRSGDEARLLDHEAYVAFLDTLRQAGSASTARSP